MRKIRVVLILAFLPWGIALADEVKLTSFLSARQAYNDNIFFDTEGEEADSITTVSAALELSNRSERLDLNLRGELSPFYYRENSDLREVDQSYRGRLGYRISPRLSAEARGSLRVDHRPGREIEETGIVFDDRRSVRRQYGGAATYALNEISNLSFSYAYDREDWDVSAGTDSEDFEGHTVSVGLTRSLDGWMANTSMSLTGGYGSYTYETSDTKSGFGQIGLVHRLNELFTLRGALGARYNRSDFETTRLQFIPPFFMISVRVNESDSSWGALGDLSLEYRGERSRSSIGISHDLRTGIGTAGPSYLTRLSTDMSYRVLEKLAVGASAGYFVNRAEADRFARREIDQDTFFLRPRIRWEFYDRFTLEGAYTYTTVSNDVTGSRAEQNIVYLQLAYGLPLLD
jgi:hypothetical protein